MDLADPDAHRAGDRLGADGEDFGLFGPDTVTWRIHQEPALALGMGRAILMQLAHPSVAAGVAQHSGFPSVAWRRVLHTLQVGTRISFGDAATSRRAADGLKALHRSVRGVRADGHSYRADDPDLLLWVWATLVESAVVGYAILVAPLHEDDVERYYQEQQRFALACGVPDGHWPPDYRSLLAYIEDMIERHLDATPEARRIAASVLMPPVPAPLGLAARFVLELLKLTTVGLLPPAVRRQYELQWGPAREAIFRGAMQATRRASAVRPGLPPRARAAAQLLSALSRMPEP